jgi:hypothetical protein
MEAMLSRVTSLRELDVSVLSLDDVDPRTLSTVELPLLEKLKFSVSCSAYACMP